MRKVDLGTVLLSAEPSDSPESLPDPGQERGSRSQQQTDRMSLAYDASGPDGVQP